MLICTKYTNWWGAFLGAPDWDTKQLLTTILDELEKIIESAIDENGNVIKSKHVDWNVFFLTASLKI
jgi:hypothetical protein